MGDGSTRYASRILLFEPGGRFLLFLEEYDDQPGLGRWITPGGGREPGEGPEATAIRELHEETGLRVERLGSVVHEAEFPVRRPTARHSFAHWSFFVHQVDAAFDPSRVLWTEEEQRTVKDVRWWSLGELIASHEPYSPRDLPELVTRFAPPQQPARSRIPR